MNFWVLPSTVRECLTLQLLQNVSSAWEHEVVMFDKNVACGCSVLTVGGKILFLRSELREGVRGRRDECRP